MGVSRPTSVRSTSSRLPVALRVGAVAVGALVVWLAITSVSTAVWGEETTLARHVASALAALVLGVLLVVVARRRLDRRPLATLGLTTGTAALRDLAYGALSWLLPAAIGLTVALSAGWLEITVHATAAETVTAVLLVACLVLVYEAVPEELVFRGYIYRNLAAVLAPWLAVAAQALIFAAFGTILWVVTSGWGVLAERLVLFTGMALVVGCIRLISGSVWGAVGWHLAFQTVMQLAVGGRYLEVSISSGAVFTVATAVVAFATSATVAGFLWSGPQSWTEPEPDGAPGPTR